MTNPGRGLQREEHPTVPQQTKPHDWRSQVADTEKVDGLGRRALRESGRQTVLDYSVASGVPVATLWRAINKSGDLLLSTAIAIVEGAGGRLQVVWPDGRITRLEREDGR